MFKHGDDAIATVNSARNYKDVGKNVKRLLRGGAEEEEEADKTKSLRRRRKEEEEDKLDEKSVPQLKPEAIFAWHAESQQAVGAGLKY